MMNSSHNISDNCRVTRHLPDNWIVFAGFTITIYVTVVNVLLVFIFLKKKNLSSVSILLAALALTDALTSLGIFIPDFAVYTFAEVTFTEGNMKYPFCLCTEFTDISLQEGQKKKKKQPRRILHFSDGILEEYSTDEEDENPPQPVVDTVVADTCGEHLAWFFGITTPKYQYAIDEYYRLKEEEEREKKQDEKRRQRMEEEKLSHVEVDTKMPLNEQSITETSDIKVEVLKTDNQSDSQKEEKY
ncbi:unnamed protein product [Mytilus edulis]|uniref:Uncharacterized protein n=1 Tax=Mytilus edulis TaxID=6550 RepID=A0A8S3VC78_MYTED|nr:unnamed protein product [Mytilus edulis]